MALPAHFVSPLKQQIIATHTIRQTEIRASPDSWLTNTKCCVHSTIACPLYLFTYLLNYLLTYLLKYLLTYSLIYLITYLLNYLLT